MKNQNKNITEEDKFKIHVDKKTLQNPSQTKELASLKKKNPNIEFDLEPAAGSQQSSSSSMAMMEEPEAVIEPQDKATIKYLSNVKDSKTGQVSAPFTIGDKRYQMVRGITPSKEVVMAVYCHDDMDEAGQNIIHPMDYFEENIANPMKEQMEMVGQDIQVVPKKESIEFTGKEKAFQDKDAFIDYLNLVGLEGYKHFFVNIRTGEITAKFKSTKEMMKSGIMLGDNEDYMDVKALKRFRFGDYFKKDMNEETPAAGVDAGTDVSKLQADVKKLTNMIKNKFSVYLSKLDKPIEQSQFLTAMAAEIGVPLNKLSTIINSYKDIAKSETQPVTEKKIITKKQLEENLRAPKVIKTIKVKDIK